MNSEEFDSLLAKLRPVVGEMADAFWLASLLDPAQRDDVQAVARVLAAELLGESYVGGHILLEPPSEGTARGAYPLGTVVYADKPVCIFGLREDELPQHLLILGRSGAGKTNVSHILVWNLLRRRKPFIVLDWRGNYTHFAARPEGKDILVFTLGEPESLSFNPLDPPPGLSPNQREAYLRDVISVICTTYLPGHHLLSTGGVEYLLLRAMEELGRSQAEPMTSNDLRRNVEGFRARSREADWKASALNVLFKLTTGPVGRLLNSPGSACLAGILDRPVILKLDSLGSETDRALFTRTFLLWLYYHRMAEGKSATSKHVLVIEEAHQLFLRRADEGQSVHDLMLRQMRDLGEALVLLDQNPSLLSTPALGNTGTTVCLNLKHADDVEAAARALTLPRENWSFIGRLPVGHAIVKVPGRWPTPFLVRFPCFPVSRPVEPSQADGSPRPGSSVCQSVEELRSALDEAIRAIRETDRRNEKNEEIGARERSLLMDIAEHPLSVITERYERLGWTAHTGTRVKARLLEKGLAEQESVRVPNGSVTLLKLTEQGRELVASWGAEAKALPKNASLEHEYWKKLVAERYRAEGYAVEEEVPIGDGKAVDLVATKDAKRVAIEIETGKSDVDGNVRKCLGKGFTSSVVVPTPTCSRRPMSMRSRPPTRSPALR